jgi:hypothetical protein
MFDNFAESFKNNRVPHLLKIVNREQLTKMSNTGKIRYYLAIAGNWRSLSPSVIEFRKRLIYSYINP